MCDPPPPHPTPPTDTVHLSWVEKTRQTATQRHTEKRERKGGLTDDRKENSQLTNRQKTTKLLSSEEQDSTMKPGLHLAKARIHTHYFSRASYTHEFMKSTVQMLFSFFLLNHSPPSDLKVGELYLPVYFLFFCTEKVGPPFTPFNPII